MQAAATEARSFGKYTLVAKLATGGMAEIFLARLQFDGGFEKLVCIKRILPHLARDPQFVAMFLDEARVAARISHPNVCQVFELGEWQSQYYIAMEYLEGVPLSLFRRPDYYPAMPDPRLVAGFGVQACEGLHHAHQLKRPDGELLGVVHRDVSPQNLFVTVDGVVKVLDFGIAKVQDASSKTSTEAETSPYAVAPQERRTNVVTPMPPPQPTAPGVIQHSSRLPWIIAGVAVLAAAGAGVLLYMNLSQQTAPAPPAVPQKEVAMKVETAAVPV